MPNSNDQTPETDAPKPEAETPKDTTPAPEPKPEEQKPQEPADPAPEPAPAPAPQGEQKDTAQDEAKASESPQLDAKAFADEIARREKEGEAMRQELEALRSENEKLKKHAEKEAERLHKALSDSGIDPITLEAKKDASGSLTPDTYWQMSSSERAAYRAKHPSEYARIMRATKF